MGPDTAFIARGQSFSLVRQGLADAMDAPLRRPYVDALASWTQLGGAAARLELGEHLLPNVSAFTYAQLDRDGPGAGLGLRWMVP